VDKWKHLEHGAHELAKKLTSKEAGTTSGSWKILTKAAPENILFLSLTARQQAVDQKLKNFFGKWRQVKEKLPFPEMAELRITPQLPEYSKILDDAFLLLLDGKLRSHTEITHFLKPYEPPPPPPPPPVKRGRGKAAAAVATPAPGAEAALPAKRGRKPKGGAALDTTPVPVVSVPEAKPAVVGKKAPAAVAEPKKAVQAPVAKAKKAPARPAKKQAKLPAKKATAKKPAAKKASAKKAAAKKAPKKTAAKKPQTKKAPAKKAAGKKAPAKKSPKKR
jgi:tRNA nucleotidyltransferase (CCA-adding enzyme)